jgi:thiamine biosynthesis lipoprotein
MNLLGVVMAAVLAGPGAPKRWTYDEPHMGTRFKVIVYAADEATANRAAKAAFARVAELDGIMSDYKPASELMRLCKKAGSGPVRVSDELFFVLRESQEWARRSGGAFDVTVGPVVRLWRFARKTRVLPEPDELKRALALVGHDKMVLDEKAQTVELKQAGMQLDLGGIAKGYAADEAVRVLGRHGLTRALVAAAGDIVAADPPPGEKGWVVGIAPLADPDARPERFVLLANSAVSTAGDARQYVEIDGRRYSHIIDPRTGVGLPGQMSVTVTARRGIDADALETVVAVLGPEKGLRLIESTDGTACLFVRKTEKGEEAIRSKRFEEHRKP